MDKTILKKYRVWRKKPFDQKLEKCSRIILPFILKKQYLEFGKNSIIIKPLMLHGKKYIKIGNNVTIRNGARIECIDTWNGKMFQNSPELVIEDGVNIEQRVHLVCANSLTIGCDTTISFDVMIMDCSHELYPIGRSVLKNELVTDPTIIGANCFIGAGARIMPGVTLGDNCIVGANSVVTKDVPAYSIVVGIPATVIKKYDAEIGKWVKV